MKGGVSRAAIKVHARKIVEDDPEGRGVAAERVEDREDAEDQEEAELAREQAGAGDPVPEHEERRNRPGEEVVRGSVRPGALRDRVPVRAPIVVGPAQRTEDVAEQDRGEALGRQGAHDGDAVADGGPGRGRQELHGQDGRDGQQRRADRAHDQEHAHSLLDIGERTPGRANVIDNHAQETERAQKRDLIAADRHQGGREGEEDAAKVGAPVQGLFEQPQRQGIKPVAEDHARMLEPRRSRAAQNENIAAMTPPAGRQPRRRKSASIASAPGRKWAKTARSNTCIEGTGSASRTAAWSG